VKSSARGWLVNAVTVAAIVAAVLGVLAIRVVVAGRAALEVATEARARGHVDDAIRGYETAARWYLPLAPHVDEAYARLRELAASEDPQTALLAWRAIRRAALATRSLWTPHADDLAAANDAIARLSVQQPGAATTDESWHRERLARATRPPIGPLALAGLGIVLWLAGAFVLARRGLDAAGRIIVGRPAALSAATVVVGVACWALGLYIA
jgi:hypothetical protein